MFRNMVQAGSVRVIDGRLHEEDEDLFESDRWRLFFFDRTAGTSREMLPTWDRFADTYFLPRDMRAVYLATQDHGRAKLFRATFDRAGRLDAPQL